MDSAPQENPPACLNCGTPLQGNWCYACGQPVKGMVRSFSAVVGDIFETLFEYDNRIWTTLLQLYFRPGYVTNDFIAGRRARYVLPFRLFFVLSVVTFLMLQLTAVPQEWSDFGVTEGDARFARFQTVEEVIIERDQAISELEEALADVEQEPGANLAAPGINLTIDVLNASADRRIEQLTNESRAADLDSLSPEQTGSSALPVFQFEGRDLWDPQESPMEISWLPATVNQTLNEWMSRWMMQAENNLERVSTEPDRLIEAMLNLIPVALFVLMPIFALLLKIVYLFKHRMYMEHLIVALHSHSFLFLGILISILLNALRSITVELPVLDTVFNTLFTVSLIWLPVYLLLMQKRVYAQGWTMTLIKFSGLGVLYTFMILIVLTLAAIISLVNL